MTKAHIDNPNVYEKRTTRVKPVYPSKEPYQVRVCSA